MKYSAISMDAKVSNVICMDAFTPSMDDQVFCYKYGCHLGLLLVIKYSTISIKFDYKCFITMVHLSLNRKKRDFIKVQEGMIRKRRNQKEIPTPKTEVGKTKLTIRYLNLENIS